MPSGMPPPSQCSSRFSNALRDGFGEPHLARDLGAAMAARFDQFLGDLAAVLEDVDQRAKPLGQSGLHSGMRQDEAQHLRQAAVDGLEVALEGEVVGQIELADARRIAAAAEILQQQRVVELPDLALAQADLAADVDADPAAAHAMPGRLAFDHVQRVAERAEKFGEPNFCLAGD